MANKRQLKKKVNRLCANLFAETISCVVYAKVNCDDADNIMLSILNLQDDMLCRVSHVEPGMKASIFFKKMNVDLKEASDAIMQQIDALV